MVRLDRIKKTLRESTMASWKISHLSMIVHCHLWLPEGFFTHMPTETSKPTFSSGLKNNNLVNDFKRNPKKRTMYMNDSWEFVTHPAFKRFFDAVWNLRRTPSPWDIALWWSRYLANPTFPWKSPIKRWMIWTLDRVDPWSHWKLYTSIYIHDIFHGFFMGVPLGMSLKKGGE